MWDAFIEGEIEERLEKRVEKELDQRVEKKEKEWESERIALISENKSLREQLARFQAASV